MMISHVRIVALSLFFGASAGLAQAQNHPDQNATAIRINCSKEIKTQCKGVKEDGGRMIACLYSHDRKLNLRCATTVAVAILRLHDALEAVKGCSAHAYDPDARRPCSRAKPGDGNLIDCLSQARNAVSPCCNVKLDTAFLWP